MYSIFLELLKKAGVSVADVANATGIYQSKLSNWKKRDNLISMEYAVKIADYFGVTVDYLMTGKEDYYLNPETAKAAQEMFENKELRVLFDAARDAEPDDLRAVYNMLLALKRKEQK